MPSTRGGLCPSALRQLSAPVTAPIPNQVGKLFGDPGIRERGGVSPMTIQVFNAHASLIIVTLLLSPWCQSDAHFSSIKTLNMIERGAR
jgi:hypothetical protein